MIKNPVILFDGVCNLCNGTVDFIIRNDRKKQFRFVALQSESGKKFAQKFNFSSGTDSVILILNKKVYYESEAVLIIASLLNFPWNMAKVFYLIPKKMRDNIYKWIAGNRYKWFGKRSSCRIASPAEKIFFPDPEDLKF